MTSSESQIPSDAQEFFEFWSSALQHSKGAGDENTDWRQELAKFWEQQQPEDSEQARKFYDNLLAAAAFYRQFSKTYEENVEAGGVEDDAKLFYLIPLRLFEQHMEAVGIHPEGWEGWLQSLKEEPKTLERYNAQVEVLRDSVRVYMEGFSTMVSRAAERYKKQDVSKDVQKAFSVWVDCFESEYGEFIRSSEYPQQFAAVINGSLELQQTLRTLSEPWREMGAPFDVVECHKLKKHNEALQEQVAELRRENQKLKQRMEGR